ncbi:MAG: carboxy-S-adenosyl-L-methionine synthase CmoA [Acidobacteria bacterium]|nr:carboxy-S-adenosyl-L-methionine synthase CmoA [Acidobacteriota bacterium]
MKKDDVFLAPESRSSDFAFDERVAQVFDDMVGRSVPFYAEQQRMICELARTFWKPGTKVYDLGASTATTLAALAATLPEEAELVGYDNSEAMLERGREKLREQKLDGRVELRTADLNEAVTSLPLEGAGVALMCWTLQFIRPLHRDHLLRHIYDSLAEDGALIVAEKVLSNRGPVNRFFIDFYYDYKRRMGYSDVEISRKREALENVMIPYRIDENLELFRRSGFEIVETYFQWYNFAGFLCVKKAGLRTAG